MYYQPLDFLLSDLQKWSMSNILEACGLFNSIKFWVDSLDKDIDCEACLSISGEKKL